MAGPPFKTARIMKGFLETMMKDIYAEHFTRKEYMVYGVVVPLAMVAAVVLAGIIERA